MKISTKGRYALRTMVDLAQNNNGGFIKLREIAARQEISDKYLEQIITLLNRAGYVKSVRGASGGYRLSKKPEEYTVGMILRLTEGSLAPVACLDDEVNECSRYQKCATVEIFKQIGDAVNSVIDHTTLQDLLETENEKSK